MEQFHASVIAALWIIWTIVCFVLYHKVFAVYYFSLFYGLYKEILCCMLAGALLAGLSLMFSAPVAIVLVIIGFSITRKIDSGFLRNTTFFLIVILAIIIFFSGRWFRKNMEPENYVDNDINTEIIDDTYVSNTNSDEIFDEQAENEETVEYTVQDQIDESDEYIETYSAHDNYATDSHEPETQEVNISGVVLESSGGLNIRSGPGIQYEEVGRLAPNEKVHILELIESDSSSWGKIDRGWICMDYIVTGETESSNVEHRIGYITGSNDGVNVRRGPAVSYEQVGKVYLGQQVEVTELYHNGVSEWANIGYGWVCTDYISWNMPTGGTDYYDTPIYSNPIPTDPTESIVDENGREFVGYDCNGCELYVGYIVRLGTRSGTTEYAVGEIISCLSGDLAVVEFKEIFDDYGQTGDILYCMDGLADRIIANGSYSCTVEPQYLEIHYWG